MKESRKSWRFCQRWCVKLKQLPFSLMYLLFRQNDCLYCKCGILRHVTIFRKSLHTSQAAFLDCDLVYFCSMEQPGWGVWVNGMLVQRREEINWSNQDLNCFSDSLLMRLSSIRDNCIPFFVLSSPLPVFKPWRTRYESVNYGISNYWST